MLDGSWLFLNGSAIRLSFNPCPFNLVCPCTTVVEKGGKVIGLVVFNSWLLDRHSLLIFSGRED